MKGSWMGWIGILVAAKRETERETGGKGRPVKSLKQLRWIEWREQPGQDYTETEETEGL